MGYYFHSAYHQAKLMNSRQPLTKVLQSSKLTEEQKRKLRLVEEVKAFGEAHLGLKPTRNYSTYVQLDEAYVTYIVQAAYARELRAYEWSFPFVGKVPYKGYFRRQLADEEAASFSRDEFDTYVRGVSAYSTLGWLQDSVLSSMLRYDDHDLAELILHESIHTTLFVKSAAEFNERLATFLGHQGMKLFYRQKEGPESPTLKKADADTEDQKIFSAFITQEIKLLKKWYEENKFTPERKIERLKEIQTRFATEALPRMKGESYRDFGKRPLNNAILLAYRTYEYSLEDFDKLLAHFGGDFGKTFDWLKGLKDEKEPDKRLKEFVTKGA